MAEAPLRQGIRRRPQGLSNGPAASSFRKTRLGGAASRDALLHPGGAVRDDCAGDAQGTMTQPLVPDAWRRPGGVVAIIGLGKSAGAAAEALKGVPGVEVELGRHDLNKIRAAAGVVVSPGVPPDAPVLSAARHAGVEIVSELDLGFRALATLPGGGPRSIAITGTNGKTTTTALVAHLLSAAGLRATTAGNIGRPVTDLALANERYQWLSLEVSSFQLHDSPNFAPDIGMLTNLAPDHLDRYPSADAYYADKRLLFRNAGDDDVG